MNWTENDAEETRSWWGDIIYNEDGSLNEDKVLRELHDFKHMIDEVPVVYSHITCEQMSKPNYFARDVIQVADECVQGMLADAVSDSVHDALERMEAGETYAEIMKDYPDSHGKLPRHE